MNMQQNTALPHEIYHKIRDDIAYLNLKPGSKLSEAGIARQYGCSRVPVREAFKQLVMEGALEAYPQRGNFVTKIRMSSVQESRYLREVLETKVVLTDFDKGLLTPIASYLNSMVNRQSECLAVNDYKKAWDLDNEFHRIFFAVDNKEFALAHTGNYEIHYMRARLLSLMLEPQGSIMIGQHRDIINAITKGNRIELERILNSHFTNVLDTLSTDTLVERGYFDYIEYN